MPIRRGTFLVPMILVLAVAVAIFTQLLPATHQLGHIAGTSTFLGEIPFLPQHVIEKAPLLSPIEKFVALSDLLPNHRGSCPDLPGYPAKWFNFRDLNLCLNVLKRASDQGGCIIYNFGVGKSDPFLAFMSKTRKFHCQVFAFDPFVQRENIKTKLGNNVHFYQIGLWNGQANRHVGRKGKLMSLGEIQAMLNHTTDTRISLFRSDCEGCEYGWIKYAMDQDESLFDRIDQLFIEIHTVPIHFMNSISLEWKAGLPPRNLLEPVYDMLTTHFRLISGAVNPGGPSDREKVPEELRKQGVIRYPCCREFNMVNVRLAAPAKSPDEAPGVKPCQRLTNPNNPFEGLSDEFVNLFHGQRKTCPGDETPRCFQDRCYCDQILARDSEEQKCVVYFFVDLQAVSSSSFRMLRTVAQAYPGCSIWVYDPRTEKYSGKKLLKEHNMSSVLYHPWGLYSGTGPRFVKPAGELYTMAEITLSWSKNLATTRDIPVPGTPTHISLMHIDWEMADPCTWQHEILLKGTKFWWGAYRGNETVQQLV